MDGGSPRSQTPLILVLAGSAIALAALIMPWYTVDMAAFEQAFRQMMSVLAERLGEEMPGFEANVDPASLQQQIEQGWTLGKGQLEQEFKAELVGWKVFSIPALVISVLAAAGAVAAAAKCWNGETSAQDASVQVVPLGLVLAARPLWAYFKPPMPNAGEAAELSQLGLTIPDGFLSPAMGIWVGLAGAILVLTGAILLRGEPAEETLAYVDLSAPTPAAAPGGAYVPTPAATAYQQQPQPPAAYGQHQAPPPQAYPPQPAYGQQPPAYGQPPQPPAYGQPPQAPPAYGQPQQAPPGYGQPPAPGQPPQSSAPPPGPYYQSPPQ